MPSPDTTNTAWKLKTLKSMEDNDSPLSSFRWWCEKMHKRSAEGEAAREAICEAVDEAAGEDMDEWKTRIF